MTQFLRPFLRVAQIVFALFLVYFALRLFSYHIALVTFPFPDALREGAMMTSTKALVKGLNPYAMSLQPWFMNQYGIIYPLLVWPWAKLFGVTILIHRMVTAFFVVASCALIYVVLKRMNIPILLNIWVVLMLYASLLYPGTSTATIDPGGIGTFFFLLTIFIPWFSKYSYRSLVISVVCGIVAFYTKPYVFLGTLIMLSYVFLFVSKRKGFFYGAVLLLLSVISIVVVNQILPAYFDNCFFTSANMAPAWSSMERLHEQIVKYGDLHKWIFILIGAHLLWYVFRNFQTKQIASLFSKDPGNDSIKLIVYAAMCSSFVLYMSLGRHSGAMLWYFFQLLSPFFLVGAVWLFSRYSFWPILCAPFLILTLHTMAIDQNYRSFDKKMAGWSEMTFLLKQHQHVLNSSLIAPLLIQDNKEIIDDGQAEYFLSGGQRNYWMKGWLKEDDRIYLQQILFFENIRDMVENKQFDLIVLQPSLLPMGVADDIRKYYKFEGQVMLYAPQDRRPYALTVWLPL